MAKARKAAQKAKPLTLRQAREAKGLSVKAVAEAVGFSSSAVSRAERGVCTPRSALADKLVAYYKGAVPKDSVRPPPVISDNDTPLLRQRKQLGKELFEVAAAVDCHPSSLLRIERGQQMPRRELAEALYAYYGGKVSKAAIYDPAGER